VRSYSPAHSSTRLERGITLAEGRFEEITRVAPWLWEVPSCTGANVYRTNLKQGHCSCPDRVPEGERCKHEHAAGYVKGRTFTCDGCAARTRYREGVEVGEDNLTFYPGIWVSGDCALHHGVL
jgi:hypothetical protein